MGIDAEQGQLPVQAEQHGGHADQGDGVDHHIGDGMRDELLEQVGVVDHVGHQLSDLLVLIEAQGQALHVVVDVLAHIRHHTPARHMCHIGAQELQAGARDEDRQHDEGQPW